MRYKLLQNRVDGLHDKIYKNLNNKKAQIDHHGIKVVHFN